MQYSVARKLSMQTLSLSDVVVQPQSPYKLYMESQKPHSSPGSTQIDLRSFDIDSHKITLLHQPEIRLEAFLSLIENARSEICMFTYMINDDATGNQVRSALMDATTRGVAVELIVDSFGSADTKVAFFEPLIQCGVQFCYFGSRWGVGYLIRNHQKMLIVDAQSAIVGGFNITDTYFGRKGNESWEDFGIMVRGRNVADLLSYYRQLSDLARGGKIAFRKLRRLIRNWRPGSGTFQWVLGGPTNRISPWALSLKRDLEIAQKTDIVCAYFSPSQTILRRIAGAAPGKRGNGAGQVRLILAGKTDNGATIGAARLLYTYMMKRGVTIFEFQPRPLHMKLLIIDNACYIGSANLDVRSLFINLEIMLRIEDAGLASALRIMLDNMAVQSVKQDMETHRKRARFLIRTKWALSYFLVNTVDYTIGRRIKFGLLQK